MYNIVQIISLVSGIVYMVMQIFQHRWMWYMNLVTCITALAVTLFNSESGVWAPLWAQVLLNAYFIAMSFVGIFTWKGLEEKSGDKLHIVPLGRKKAVLTIAAGVIGTPLLCLLLSLTNDPEPVADGISFALSILAAWYLACSHIENWHLWIAADAAVVYVFASQADWWMAALYVCYIISALIGLGYWRRNGIAV